MRGSRFSLGLAGLVAGLLLGELALGWVHPQIYRRPRVWQFDPELGWSHIPGSAGRLVTPEFSVEYRINSAGLRDGERPLEKPAGVRRVLVFGDSFAEGWGVPREESVSARLEARLEGVEALNFGVAGYGTDQEWLLFERQGREYQPDLVAVFFYGNDLWNNASRQGIGAERGYKPFFQLEPEGGLRLAGVPVKKLEFWDQEAALPWKGGLERYLQQHWHLYVFLRKALVPEVPLRQQQDYYEGLYGTRDDPRQARGWALTSRILKEFSARVEGTGGRMLLVYVPAIVQIEDEDWRMKRELHGLVADYDLFRPNRQLALLCEQYGIPLLDLYESFRQAARTRTLYFRDSHWNAQGHDLAAEQLAAYLRQQGWRGSAP